MIEPTGKSDTESAITVVFVSQTGAVVGSRWVYCETARMKDPAFIEYVLVDQLKHNGPSRFSGAVATWVPGLVSDGEACVYLHSEQRKHTMFDHDGHTWTMEAGGQPQMETHT